MVLILDMAIATAKLDQGTIGICNEQLRIRGMLND